MKLTSVIYLILSVVLVFAGIFVCSYARSLAPNDEAIDGADITDGVIYTELEYSDQNVSKISLDLTDCTVTIKGGAKSSYVELTNFEPNKYIGNVANKTLTISNNISIMDYLSFDGTGVSFAGVWQTLRSMYLGDSDSADREVVIHVADDEEIKQLTLNLVNSNIRILEIPQECDITLTCENSTVEMNTVVASTMKVSSVDTSLSLMAINAKELELSADGGEIITRNVSVADAQFDVGETDISLFNTDFEVLAMDIEAGDIKWTTSYAKESYSYSYTVNEGSITINGEEIGLTESYKDNELPGKIDIKIESGTLAIEFGENMIEVPSTEEAPVTGEETTETQE